ncbi:unnamed protein product [Periconia digitata]|uniref:Uncharacterized protein n=1 Tax=Periconia digitata TaxID=1303443 RepID=A0A9W4U4H3_9PLEO|nr:unnamed protein product [Periconia digitata]
MNRKPNGKAAVNGHTNGDANGHSRTEREKSPPKRFDGVHMGAWVDWLPASWKPYIQLARMSPPVPLLLIFFPHLFGVAHAAVTRQASLDDILRVSGILLGGSFFFSNAIHGWNDLVDAPIDAQIPRTANRPIPRGAISPRAAFIFTAINALIALLFFLPLPVDAICASVPAIVTNYYYPYSKRHTKIPQVILGVALQWAVVLGSTAMGVSSAWTDPSVLSLFFASLIWTIIYDTIYGFQDYEVDVKLGVGSTAVLFGITYGRLILWFLSEVVVGLLFASGYIEGMSWVYTAIAAGGSFASLNLMMAMVDVRNPESCSWWFAYGFWGPAFSISLGLLGEYAL